MFWGFSKKWPRSWTIELVVVLLVSVGLLVHGLRMVGDFRIDDAYITFAYSKNVALGHGPIYGHDLKVEGYSNFLWMMLIAVGQSLSADALTTARVLGQLSFFVLLIAVFLGARKMADRVPAILVTLVAAASTDFHRLVQSGLETVFFSGLLACGTVHYLLEDKARRRFSALWFAFAALTRIDGFIPLGLLLGLEFLRAIGSKGRVDWRAWLVWAGLGLAPVALYWAWRISYYGLLFPLPYYAKASLGMLEFDRGVDYVVGGLRDTGLWVAVLLAAFGLSLRGRRPTAIVFVWLGAMTGYVAYVGGDWMPFNRMLMPLAAPLLVLCAVGMDKLMRETTGTTLAMRMGAFCAVVLAAGFMAQHENQVSIDTPQEKAKVGHTEHLYRHTLALVDALPYVNAMIRAPGDTLVTDYGGVYAYGTDASVVEMWGLANKEIALRGNTDGINPIYGKTCVPCYADFRPDYFHSVTPLLRGDHDFRSVRALIGQIFQGGAIDRVIGLRKNYVLGRVRNPQSGQTLWFLERKRPGVTFEQRSVGELVVDYPSR